MPLLDQFGNPIKPADLKEPQTARVVALQNRYIDSHMEGITPVSAARILREADLGDILAQHSLFDDMLDRDVHLACEFGKRAGALEGIDWQVTPPMNASAAEKADAQWAEEILRDAVDDLEDILAAMMEAVGHGFAAIEIEWQKQDGLTLPKFYPRPQTWFRLSPDRRELRLADGSPDGLPMRPLNWIFHQHGKPKTGYLGRAGICRCLIWPFIYKHYSVGDFAEFLEIYGLPIILGKYYQGATPAEKSSLMRAVTALGHDARAIMPKEMELEVQKITGAGDGSVHLAMVDWAERSQSKAILGQTLSAEAKATGMGSGVADLHSQVRHDILKSDTRRVAGTLTRDLVYMLLAVNHKGGDLHRRCPRWEFDLGEAENIETYAKYIPVLAAGGMRVSLDYLHEKLRVPKAGESEEIFKATPPAELVEGVALRSAPSLDKGRAGEGFAALKSAQEQNDVRDNPRHPAEVQAGKGKGAIPLAQKTETGDAIDALIAAESQNWQPLLDPLLAPLQAALDEAIKSGETAAQFIARLPALLAQMDAAPLADQLTQTAFIARLAGLANLPLDE